jgi:MFS transporter, PPP family, 3-phenylpropionic acid transporter
LRGLFILLGVAEAAVLPFIPLFLRGRGLRPAEIGLLLSAMAVVVVAVNPLWGYIADRHLGPVRCLVASAAGGAVIALCTALSIGMRAAIVLLIVLWGFRSPLASLSDALALQHLGAGERSGYGSVRLWTSAGFAAAAVVWGALLVALPLTAMLLFYVVGLAALATWAWTVVPPDDRSAASLEVSPRPVATRSALSGLFPFLVALLFVSTAFVAAWNFVVLRIAGLGGSALVVGAGAGLQATAEIPAMHQCRKVIARIGQRGLFSTGCALYAVSFLAWSFMSDPAWIAAVRLAVGIGFAFVYVGTVVIVDDLVPPELRATGQGLAKAVAYGLAPVAGALGGGVLYEAVGPRILFGVAAGLAATAGLIAPLVGG